MSDKRTNDRPSYRLRSPLAWLALALLALSLALQASSRPQAEGLEQGRTGKQAASRAGVAAFENTPDSLSRAGPPRRAPVQTPAPTPLPWSGNEPVNILLLGVDSGDWDSDDRAGPPRSDTMIFLTVDPVRKTAGMLSIPRDLWVDIPGTENGNRINVAHRFGEIYRLPGGGPALAVRTVEGLLGVPIHYYVRVDFAAFVKLIDSIGGVKLNIPEKISIDLRGGGSKTKKTLQPGIQTLPGEWALAYARARHTKRGDFDRIQRQLQVIQAVRGRILDLDLLPNLILQAPSLYRSLQQGIQTNLTLDRAIRLAWLSQQIPAGNVRTLAIGSRDTIAGTLEETGEAVMRPNPERIQALVATLFPASSGVAPIPDLQARMRLEDARLALVDATGQPGVAGQAARYFEQQGLQVVRITQDSAVARDTRVLSHTGKLYAIRYLATLMGLLWDNIQVAPQPVEAEPVDLTVILGSSWTRLRLPTQTP